jgi:hypothetical protein
MRTDLEITLDGMNVLIEKMGILEAEKFITLVNFKGFDYTLWRKKLWQPKTIGELSQEAMKTQSNNKK